ncbi:hypothetical protein GUJ93_ZPchr0007g5003 [Zizania palustris]|uniref:Uncharacterized protein n=1 Tax=Zizania palustris TaxID=103762 RepID=A0A8J5T461_ZIZPA|nr:hypothetical protein GUJ93_ZPchr0007g5003 [Zizania palustris]
MGKDSVAVLGPLARLVNVSSVESDVVRPGFSPLRGDIRPPDCDPIRRSRGGISPEAVLRDALAVTIAKEDTALRVAIPVRQRVAVRISPLESLFASSPSASAISFYPSRCILHPYQPEQQQWQQGHILTVDRLLSVALLLPEFTERIPVLPPREKSHLHANPSNHINRV